MSAKKAGRTTNWYWTRYTNERLLYTLKCELLDRRKFQTKAEARMAIFEFIKGWYNPTRRHSALGYQSPIVYERRQAERLESDSV